MFEECRHRTVELFRGARAWQVVKPEGADLHEADPVGATEHLREACAHVRAAARALCRVRPVESCCAGMLWRASRCEAPAFVPPIVLPTDPNKEQWDMIIMLLILYSSVFVPVRVCFGAEAEGLVWWFEMTLSLFFLADLAVAFNTSFMSDADGSWVMNRCLIAQRYLRGFDIFRSVFLFSFCLFFSRRTADARAARAGPCPRYTT